MFRIRFEFIERKAKRLRDRLGYEDLNLDMKKLLKSNKITFIERDLPDDISGVSMITKERKKFIIVNKNQSENRKKFTIAHELGHILLKHSTSLNTQKHADDSKRASQILFRNQNSSDGSDWKEVEANRFAAALLMPRHLLDLEIEKIQKNNSKNYLSELDVYKLSDIFGVSTIAMSIRLTSLGFA